MRTIGMFTMAALLAGTGIAGAATISTPTVSDGETSATVAREIRMYPRYTIWDNVNLRVEDGHVELLGEVSQPFKREDLARVAQRVPGVRSVTNQLKVLPLSAHDDRLRMQVARAVYGDATLSRYAIRANPPIHIVVENGRVTLEGVVSTEMEKQVAGMRASAAGLSFGPVVNNLRVENPTSRKG
jgi:hyperosmotically inducible periplasmic protein